MNNRLRIRDRYLRDPLPVRLGGLAANLARVRSFSDNPAHRDVVAQLLEESAWFIEWTAPDAALETQLSLLDCQRELTRWRHRWGAVWDDPDHRGAMAARAGEWAEKFVSLSGLLVAASQASKTHRS